MKVVWTLVAVVVVVVAVGALVMFTGVYNVAASDPHNALVRWVLSTTRVNAVRARAGEEVAVPPGLGDAAVIESGARKYAEMCAECHGSPVEKGHEWARHMRPAPPEMGHVARFWEPQEIYWIIEHGFKMTGMPTWGQLMEPDEMWAVTAFVEAYPQMSAEQYRSLTAGAVEEGGGDGHGGGSDGNQSREQPAAAPQEAEPAGSAE